MSEETTRAFRWLSSELACLLFRSIFFTLLATSHQLHIVFSMVLVLICVPLSVDGMSKQRNGEQRVFSFAQGYACDCIPLTDEVEKILESFFS